MTMKNLTQFIGACLASYLMIGCSMPSKGLYHWGVYEEVLLDRYTDPGKADPLIQIRRLQDTIHRAQSEGLSTPPGLYAHLGMLYAGIGKTKLAIAAFEKEKAKFPESAKLIDQILVRVNQGESQWPAETN